MYIGEHLEISLNNPEEVFTLGIHLDKGDSYILDENNGR